VNYHEIGILGKRVRVEARGLRASAFERRISHGEGEFLTKTTMSCGINGFYELRRLSIPKKSGQRVSPPAPIAGARDASFALQLEIGGACAPARGRLKTGKSRRGTRCLRSSARPPL